MVRRLGNTLVSSILTSAGSSSQNRPKYGIMARQLLGVFNARRSFTLQRSIRLVLEIELTVKGRFRLILSCQHISVQFGLVIYFMTEEKRRILEDFN
jgi:hypothetical protein